MMRREGIPVSRAIRIVLRLITSVLAISAVIIIIGGGFWYMWQDAHDKTPNVRFEITAPKIERSIIGLYLDYKGAEAAGPVDANNHQEFPFVVESGQSVTGVAYNLERAGLISDADLFRRVVQYWEADGDIQVGVYALRRDMDMESIMRELQHGRLPTTTITVPEGWRVEQIGEMLEEMDVVSATDFIFAVRTSSPSGNFLNDRPGNAPGGLEGYLFPDTYQMPQLATPQRIVEIMLQNFDRRVPDTLLDEARAQGLTIYDVLTLASIVEREAVIASERPLIAGVYRNRLDIGMYMQSDPTVQYAKGYSEETERWWNPMIQEEAITVVSPYNTFLNPGLPPGPICNPGLASIRAVVEPEESDYLFFYARGDGSHAFAATYEEHLDNQALYGPPD